MKVTPLPWSVVQQQGETFDVSLPEFAEGQGLSAERGTDRAGSC